jgi:hypothetical protein
MKTGEKCILVANGARHMGTVLNSRHSRPMLGPGGQISEAMGEMTVAVDGIVTLVGSDSDLLIEMDGTEHPIVLGQSKPASGAGLQARTLVLAYVKPEPEVPTAAMDVKDPRKT